MQLTRIYPMGELGSLAFIQGHWPSFLGGIDLESLVGAATRPGETKIEQPKNQPVLIYTLDRLEMSKRKSHDVGLRG